MQIHEAIADIMAQVPAITKERRNQAQGYNFRGIDDVYIAVHPLFVRHGVFSVPNVLEERTEERVTTKGSALIYRVLRIRYDFFARDGSSITATVIGEGMDSGDKAANKAMSVAHKYAIMQILAIPTEETVDPEVDSHEVRPKPAPDPAREAKIAAIKILLETRDPDGSLGLGAALWMKNRGNLDAIKQELEGMAKAAEQPEEEPVEEAV